jgi:hypothetical protein
MNITISAVDQGLVSSISVVNRFLRTRDRVEVDLDRSATARANRSRVSLKPSNRLLELVATSRASEEIDIGIV